MTGNAPALEKGLKILELLIATHEPLTLSQVAEAVGFKVSEIQRMVDYLARDRYIVKTPAGAYRPGLRAFALANLQLESALISRAEGPLKSYSIRTKESVHLGILAERMLHVVYSVDGFGTVRVSINPGIYKAEDTVSGRLLLAYAARGEGGAEASTIVRERMAFGELPCAQGVYAIAVPVCLGGEACSATIATPYLLKPGQASTRLRDDLLRELNASAAEIVSLF